MNILITGATGFIGRYLLQQLIEEGHFCRCLITQTGNLDNLFQHSNIEIFQGDITKPETLRGIAKNINVVYHLAAAGHVASVSEEELKAFINLNVYGTKNIVKACGKNGIERFIHFSSTAAMGLIKRPKIDESVPCRPQTPYQRSKYESELAALELGEKYGIDVIILRPCMVYGTGGKGEFLKFCRLIKKGIFPRIGTGKNFTPIVHVKDVVQAAVSALDANVKTKIFLIASKTSPPLKIIHKYITEAMQIKRPYFYVPLWAAILLAGFFEKIAEITGNTPIVSKKNIISVSTGRIFDISNAKKELNYKPSVPLEEGVRDMVQWCFKNNIL